ncbi:ankyrin repeat domain-containing protein [Streptomyces sp. H39-S7]|uniref:ankyrin repeat domain-containing protein n=1 Tax=Streptomyces sp. H39-S7 TaxID=3004357 RepID=UPI0022AE9A9C|nr:ankyrin repeat domain-containing protein [Streptomyces sp. H39-S7]MCZ4119138.1 ankyrin repeat domain-containing protein [Streptomyces sp. H39-S7]
MNIEASRRLLDAIKASDVPGVERSLALGADPNASLGRTQGSALAFSAGTGDLRIVRLLLESGADIGTSDPYVLSPLRRAIKECHPAVTQLLLEQGAVDWETAGPSDVLADAMSAVRHMPHAPALQIMQMVLAHGARPQPGSMASLVGAVALRVPPAVLRALVGAGDDPNQRRGDGTPVLVLAARRGDSAAVDVLLQAGADVDAVDAEGRTALMHAVERDEQDVVSVLLLAGADIDKINGDGTTARELAKGWQRKRVRILLGERVVGLDYAPIPRSVMGIRATGYTLTGDPDIFERWARLLEHAVKDLGSEEWEAHTGRSTDNAVDLVGRLRDEPQPVSNAPWHALGITADELAVLRAALLELAHGSPGAMPIGMGQDEIVDIYEELDRRIN